MNALLAMLWAIISSCYFWSGDTKLAIGYMALSLLAQIAHKLGERK